MKAPHESGLAREGFARQRGALETLADASYERLKQAADRRTYESRSGGHSISIRSGFLERRSGAAATPVSEGARAQLLRFRPGLLGCRQALASQVLVSTRIHSDLKSYKDEAKRRPLCARVNTAVSGLLPV